MDETIRDAIAQVLYETDQQITDPDAWKYLHPVAKARWHARAELAVQMYLSLTTKRYATLTDAEIAPHVDKERVYEPLTPEEIGKRIIEYEAQLQAKRSISQTEAIDET